jgi:hypothetical protein
MAEGISRGAPEGKVGLSEGCSAPFTLARLDRAILFAGRGKDAPVKPGQGEDGESVRCVLRADAVSVAKAMLPMTWVGGADRNRGWLRNFVAR